MCGMRLRFKHNFFFNIENFFKHFKSGFVKKLFFLKLVNGALKKSMMLLT